MRVALVYADANESPECDRCSAARLAQMCALLETRCELALIARSALSADICRADLVLCAGGSVKRHCLAEALGVFLNCLDLCADLFKRQNIFGNTIVACIHGVVID